MNLNEERNYQKLMDILDVLELSEKNQKLAEEYVSPEQSARPELLKEVEQQDFSKLDKEKQRKSTEYVEHCKKRNRMEILERYVRFLVAVGGSTATYMLNNSGWNVNTIQEYLTKEQFIAMRAEGLVWNNYALNQRMMKQLFDTGKQEPEVLRGAMELCYHEHTNAKVLLASIYLNNKKPQEKKGGLLKGLISKNSSNEDSEIQNTVKFLEDNLIGSLSSILSSPKPNDTELKRLKDLVRDGKPESPIPEDLLKLLHSNQPSGYLITLLSACAFLAMEHSKCLVVFLQLMAVLSSNATLSACKAMAEHSWFYGHLEELEKLLPLKTDDFIRWYISSKEVEGLVRMAARYPEAMKTAVEQTSTDEYLFVTEQIKKGNPALYRQLETPAISGKYQVKLAGEMVGRYTTGQTEAKNYLLGEGSLEDLFPFVNSWRGGYHYDYRRFQKLNDLQRMNKEMFQRGVILEALQMQGSYFISYFLTPGGANKDKELHRKKYEKDVEKLVQLFEDEKLPIHYQMDAMEGIYNAYYWEGDKTLFLDLAAEAVSKRRKEHEQELRDATKESTAIGRCLCIRVLDYFWQEEKETILSCALDSSKQVREQLVTICTLHKEWEPEIRSGLSSKKSQERELSIRVMKAWGAKKYQEELTKALEVEKSKKLKELLQSCLGIEGKAEIEEAKVETPQQLATQILKGGKKRKVAWAYETPFSPVHKKDGSVAEEDYMQALLVSYADMPVPGVSPEAGILADHLEEKELADYMAELFDKWVEAGAEAKKKWVLYAVSLHGTEKIVPAFRRQIQEWPQHARGAMAAEAVKALALNGSSQALLFVDQISRKFKFRQVKAAAAAALEYAASSLGISRAQLEDRIVPNLGFDEKMERIFDYGTRSFHVYLTPALELEIFDEAQKKLKNLPAPGKRDEQETAAAAYAEFKDLKKQLKTVVSNQKLRLEQALTAERLWSLSAWEELFVKNPVMHQFAIGLIWGVYEDGVLKDTFRYMEDGSFNTMDEEEIRLPETGSIGLVHPIELEKESLSTWKEQLEDYEVVQPIEQLNRPVYRLTEEEKGEKELTRFGGKLLNGLSLSGKLQGMGWYRGSVQDAGIYSSFYREDGPIGVELEFSGSYVGDENDEVTVYGVNFYKAGTVKRGSYVYDTIKNENSYLLEEINPRYFSEIVLQLEKATASSQEQLDYPECKR